MRRWPGYRINYSMVRANLYSGYGIVITYPSQPPWCERPLPPVADLPSHARGVSRFFSHAVRSSGFLRMLNMAGGFLIDVLVL